MAMITGTNGTDVLSGTDAADTIYGFDGNDKLDGGSGDDTLYGGLGDDTVNGGAGNDTLYGDDGNDTLNGGGGNDVLDGRSGSDTMAGGAGNDIYYVDSAGDIVTEAASAGNDLVRSTVSYALTSNVERLELFGTAANGTGNALDNTINGNDAANVLDGLDGNDTLYGGIGNDVLKGGNGNDLLDGGYGFDNMQGGLGDDSYYVDQTNFGVVKASDVCTDVFAGGTDTVFAKCDYVLSAYIENLTLFVPSSGLGGSGGLDIRHGGGNALANIIQGHNGYNELYGYAGDDTLRGNGGDDLLDGGTGNDVLDGGIGADSMYGGTGDDIYIVDNAGDHAVESTGADGNDTVLSTVSYTIATQIEELMLMGSDHLIGTGNTQGNVLRGNSGNNELYGLGGNDTLVGGGGADLLTGGDGADVFDFDNISDSTPGSQHDVIADYQSVKLATLDVIDLRDIDANVNNTGNQAFVWIGSAAFSAPGQLRYANGMLQGSVDSDAAPEFEVELVGAPNLVVNATEHDVLL